MGALTSDFVEKLRVKATEWSYEDFDHHASQVAPIVRKWPIEGVYDIKTSAIGVSMPTEQPEGESTDSVKLQEGYSVMRAKKCYSQKTSWSKHCNKANIEAELKDLTKEWNEYFVDLENKLLADLFQNGFKTAGDSIFNNSVKAMTDSSGDLCYDGKPFFNLDGNDRASKNQTTGTYYNGLALNLNTTNLEAALALGCVTNAKNERDQVIKMRYDTLVTGPVLSPSAKRLLESELIPGLNQNDINIHRGALKHVMLDFITDTDFWAIGKAQKGIWFDSDGAEPVFNTWQDPDTGEIFVRAEKWVSIGVYNWRYWVASNGSTS